MPLLNRCDEGYSTMVFYSDLPGTGVYQNFVTFFFNTFENIYKNYLRWKPPPEGRSHLRNIHIKCLSFYPHNIDF